ncbi:MAG: hypothetical protein LBL47_02825 [Lactobacillus sp.]|jgi:5'(3')-deoxyribonucleotidase|nr:hypothetical protein [Lactobacillus sp.]
MINIITDIDDVILDTQAGVAQFLSQKGLDYSKDVKFNNGFIDFSQYWMPEFLTSQFFRELPILQYADEVLSRFKSKGYKIFALTSPPDIGYDNRLHQLNKEFPNMFDEIIIKLGNKGEILTDMIARHNLRASDTYFIDDAPHNIKAAMIVPDLNIAWMENVQNKAFPPESKDVVIVKNMLDFEKHLKTKLG